MDRALADHRMLAPIDHPDDAHVFLTGTGLTHLGSAAGRDTNGFSLYWPVVAGRTYEVRVTDSLPLTNWPCAGGPWT